MNTKKSTPRLTLYDFKTTNNIKYTQDSSKAHLNVDVFWVLPCLYPIDVGWNIMHYIVYARKGKLSTDWLLYLTCDVHFSQYKICHLIQNKSIKKYDILSFLQSV